MSRRIPAADAGEAVQLMGRYWDKCGTNDVEHGGTSLGLPCL